jgi:hypothetical protein
MKISDMLELVDAVKSNEYSDDLKIRWLNEVEGRVLCEIRKVKPEDIKEMTGSDDVLSVPNPYSRLYLFYLASMIDFSRGDAAAFSRSNEAFEAAFTEYAKFVLRSK